MTRFRIDPALGASLGEAFVENLKVALGSLPAGTLPLAAGCTQGGAVDEHDRTFSLLGLDQSLDLVVARIGVFFTEVVGGCNCSEDPVAHNAYCVLEVRIDRTTGIAEVVSSEE